MQLLRQNHPWTNSLHLRLGSPAFLRIRSGMPRYFSSRTQGHFPQALVESLARFDFYTRPDLQVVYESAAESSPARSAWETFLSFQRWYPEESERVELLIRDGRTPAVDEIPHAVDFGICDAQGQLRLGALRREARRELD